MSKAEALKEAQKVLINQNKKIHPRPMGTLYPHR
jgi:hypothetical protein